MCFYFIHEYKFLTEKTIYQKIKINILKPLYLLRTCFFNKIIVLIDYIAIIFLQALVENNTLLNGCHLRVSRSDSTGAEHDPKCSVFVGNIPFALEDEGLRERFEKCGEIDSVRIVRDKKTNAGKGSSHIHLVLTT